MRAAKIGGNRTKIIIGFLGLSEMSLLSYLNQNTEKRTSSVVEEQNVASDFQIQRAIQWIRPAK